ncbi:heterokaryon incompatibility protein-domain-containing protein [Apiospora aurea]|uniref:Heterokaryon incompatibility protein-domain-containing protein n=1 Tax=Apiospora aurea TaxID=335848 RepID=A0ABR1QGA9_9PEZI
MRLLNTSNLRLETFADESKAPSYAILSHTWGDNEIVFDDVNTKADEEREWKDKPSARKIRMSVEQALAHGLAYIWIDTICIDKRSSAELSESINSMFEWYKRAAICYVYLADALWVEDIECCRWLCRGWTLQELIAPSHVAFFGGNWNRLGSSNSLADKLGHLTGIGEELLYRREFMGEVEDLLSSVSIATKMSWAAHRQTARKEDIAYCLMGIFGVHMPLIYGEGDKAFQRLQEEILKNTTDTSILAHEYFGSPDLLLASHPVKFGRGLTTINEASSTSLLQYFNEQITFETMVCPVGNGGKLQNYAAILDCCFGRDVFSRAALLLEPLDDRNEVFIRASKLLYHIEEPDRMFRLSGAFKGM